MNKKIILGLAEVLLWLEYMMNNAKPDIKVVRRNFKVCNLFPILFSFFLGSIFGITRNIT